MKEMRTQYIQSALDKNEEDLSGDNGYSTRLQESITSTKDARQKYIQSLTSGASTSTNY